MEAAKLIQIPENAMSPDGFIIDQGLLKEIPFAKRDSACCGCGWISAYNFLHALNVNIEWDEVRQGLEKHAMFGGRYGVNPFGLRKYLKEFPLLSPSQKLRLTLNPRKAESRVSDVKLGIIMYFHKNGGHFVMFKNQEPCGVSEPVFRFYNAVYGQTEYDMTMSEFIKRHSRYPIIFMLTCKN